MSDDLFSRWSRRKKKVAEEEAADDVPAVEEVAEPGTEEEEAALLERLGLPVPETMQKGDDFSVFMGPAVPEFLRKRALRVLWRSNPVLANLDGLNDYDEDFRSPELTQKVLKTAYQVGRGILTSTEEKDAEEAESELEDVEAPVEDGDDVEVVASNEINALSLDAEAVETAETVDPGEAEEAPRPRRMRFSPNS